MSRPRLHGWWLLLALAAAWPLSAQADARKAEVEQKLAALRAELGELQSQQQALSSQRSADEAALREAERAISQARRALRQRETELATQEAELQRLRDEESTLRARLDVQRRALETLVRAVYALGRHEQLKLLLAQDSIDQLNRRLAYHRYLQRDRLQRVSGLLGALAELARVSAAAGEQAALAAAARLAAEQALAQLQARREQRGAALQALQQQLRDGQARMRALGRDEAALSALLESLQDVLADIPRELAQARNLAQQRGRLPLPAQGRLRVGYAGTLPDGRPSQGWWIEAATGSEVRAVAHGRVAFAEWMKGYGLLVILDHGEGYMSLYAGNEALLVEAGDWIEAGQAIASAGESGGFSAAGVYFELRRGGRPLDPAGWVKRR